MKYLWLNPNGVKDTVNMETSGDFIGEYNITLIDNPQNPSPKKAKRFRSAFTTDQVNYLEKQFKKFPYIGNAHRKEVAQALNIPERAVKIWFQNRRMKEKKETTIKEFDDQVGIRKSMEFTKDQLNNASVPSVNDQKPRSLPLITDMSQASCDNNKTKNAKCNIVVSNQFVQDVGIKYSGSNITDTPNVITTSKVIHPPPVFVKSCQLPPDYKTSAEFSIDLCKKYKDDTISKTKHLTHALKKEVVDIKKNIEHKSMSPKEQMIPEDLSSSRKMIFPTMVQQQTSSRNAPNHSGYVSLVPTVSPFYAQPYMSPSGVIWKPVNVMPVVAPSSAPISAPNNPMLNMSTVQENVMRRVCTCDCHVQPQAPYNFQQQSSPQYIITAVPFQNPSNKY